MRDRWLSLGLNRPMRINDEDCDVPMLCAEDVIGDFRAIPSEIRMKYLHIIPDVLAHLFIRFVKLSAAVGKILHFHYRPNRAIGVKDIERCEKELQECAGCSDEGGSEDWLSQLYMYQFQLLQA